jgi:conjugative relaxase-like TrwC/TraI family protein
MFSGIPQKNIAVAKEYFDEHLSHNDYYTQGEVKMGQWIGEATWRLGLQEGQNVTREQFMALCDNLNPETGKLLTQRLKANGERRVFFDFTCSAPKSVSIMAVTLNDSRIVEAHEQAAKLAAKELEHFAGTRIRKNGADDDRNTGNVVGACFVHNSSRALDPQLHTHFVLFNATWDKTEARWKALQTSEMFAASHYVTEVYRNDLRRRLHDLGYATRKTANGFEIEGVAPKIITRFSKRAQERDAMVAKLEQELGRKLSKNEVSHAVHKTRSRKLKGISSEEVRQRQLDQIGLLEKMSLQRVHREANGTPRRFDDYASPYAALDHARAHVFERNSVAPERELLHAALVKGCGQLALQPLKEALRRDSDFVRVGADYSTRQILQTELALIQTMDSGKGAVPALNKNYRAPPTLGVDQQRAVELILHSPDQFTGLRGLAGTGKTKTLRALHAGMATAGYEAVFCAPTAAAADVLRKDGFESATTLQKLLMDSEPQWVNHRTVIVLDEAGAVGLEDMKKVFDLARDRGARLILSGDTGQHSAVPRGDALRILEQHSRYSFGQLSTIRRQLRADYLEVVELAANQKPEAALQRLEQMGAVTEAPSIGPGGRAQAPSLYQCAADAYLQSVNKGKTALLVSPTWGEIEAVTEQVRNALKAQARLSVHEHSVTTLDSLSWTEAQKRNVHQYEAGQKILFLRDGHGFAKNQTAEVVEAGTNALRVKKEDGTTVELNPARLPASSVDVCLARELKVSRGDKLLLQANDRKNRLVNGQIVEVDRVENGQIHLADGRTLPQEYRRFCHGYAVTSHASQGKTVDDVFLVASSKSFAAVNREQFYVSISRGRERCHVFTDDKELLQRRVGDSRSRAAALDLVKLREALAEKGFTPRAGLRQREQPANRVSLTPGNGMRQRIMGVEPRPVRAARSNRLSVAQRLAKIGQSFRQWKEQKIARRVLRVQREQIRQQEQQRQRRGQGYGMSM